MIYDWVSFDPNFSSIRDRLSTATVNYSFVTDPTNRISDAYWELLTKAFTSPIDRLRKSQGPDQSIWDSKAAQAYLDANVAHLKWIFVLIIRQSTYS